MVADDSFNVLPSVSSIEISNLRPIKEPKRRRMISSQGFNNLCASSRDEAFAVMRNSM